MAVCRENVGRGTGEERWSRALKYSGCGQRVRGIEVGESFRLHRTVLMMIHRDLYKIIIILTMSMCVHVCMCA